MALSRSERAFRLAVVEWQSALTREIQHLLRRHDWTVVSALLGLDEMPKGRGHDPGHHVRRLRR